MKKLKVAFLWHFHQPIYKKQNEFILPWVRLHGVKDYNDLPEIFYEFPDLKQTINIVPSLWRQIEEYVANITKDKIQILTEQSPKELMANAKGDILQSFFLCNQNRMIDPYPPYRQLFDKHNAGVELSEQEIFDLQVWYNLTWIGEFSRTDPAIKRLFVKGSNFTEAEKHLVLDYHLDILKKVNKTLLRLSSMGQIELSVSPLNHPILPLLCDSESMHESLPEAKLPDTLFRFPQDAKMHIDKARDYFFEQFNKCPRGMWPSEGSISNDVLEIISKSGFLWTATDEAVLKNSLKDSYREVYKYFPVKFSRNGNNITLFFRDHSLSDAIGFQYAGWRAEDAANDFCAKLADIKKFILSETGEESLDQAVVSVILDGENCWEYYPNNGVDFLRCLFGKLTASDEFETVLFGDECSNCNSAVPVLSSICAGSWINGNFDIWMGHEEHRIAWNELAKIRSVIENLQEELTPKSRENLFELVAVAESSDWFWWYGDQHIAPNKPDFDVLFRWYLTEIYKFLKLALPSILNFPLGKLNASEAFRDAKGMLSINFPDVLSDEGMWDKAAVYLPDRNQSSMHRSGSLIKSVKIGNDRKKLYTRIQLVDDACGSSFKMTYSIKDLIKLEIGDKSFAGDVEKIAFQRDNNLISFAITSDKVLAADEIIVEMESDFMKNHIKYETICIKIMK